FESPEKQMIVADGTTLWLYQPEHRQVLKTPFRAAFQSAAPVSFLFGVGELRRDFTPSPLPSASKDVFRLKLVPKQDSEIGTLVLDVDSTSYDIAAAEVTDPLGNVTSLVFSNMKRGVGLADSLFTFAAPPGTDIIESPGAGS
ncbi:MAG: LolA family protein, partial [Candidatus Binatia bacterium]